MRPCARKTFFAHETAREPNLFVVLGVGGNTNNTRLIRKAYVGDGPDFSSPERNAARTYAFKVLSDSRRRYAYDRFGEPAPGADGRDLERQPAAP